VVPLTGIPAGLTTFSCTCSPFESQRCNIDEEVSSKMILRARCAVRGAHSKEMLADRTTFANFARSLARNAEN
jgi:hypothetical protein